MSEDILGGLQVISGLPGSIGRPNTSSKRMLAAWPGRSAGAGIIWTAFPRLCLCPSRDLDTQNPHVISTHCLSLYSLGASGVIAGSPYLMVGIQGQTQDYH